MPRLKSETKKSLTIWRFLVNNSLILIFLACLVLLGLVAFRKLFMAKSRYIYVRVKVGQGLWWASTQKPSYWMVKAFKKGDIEKDLTGQPVTTIEAVRSYPWTNPSQTGDQSQFDVYLTLKLKVSPLGNSGKYNYNRSTIGVGAPIDLEFPQLQVSGTVTDLSQNPFQDSYLEKVIYLANPYAYTWDYDNIKIGDSYFDGTEKVFEILDKYDSGLSQATGSSADTRRYTIVKARVKVKQVNDQYVFGEEQVVTVGKSLNISTVNAVFSNYVISKIE
jgi:hypothetical protein